VGVHEAEPSTPPASRPSHPPARTVNLPQNRLPNTETDRSRCVLRVKDRTAIAADRAGQNDGPVRERRSMPAEGTGAFRHPTRTARRYAVVQVGLSQLGQDSPVDRTGCWWPGACWRAGSPQRDFLKRDQIRMPAPSSATRRAAPLLEVTGSIPPRVAAIPWTNGVSSVAARCSRDRFRIHVAGHDVMLR